MQTAADVMVEPLVVSPDTNVRDLAQALVDQRSDGACVVDDGKLVGVATTMDLVFREASLHIPTTFVLLDAVITMPGQRKKMEEELERITATVVGDMMSRDPIAVSPASTLQECADLMVNKHLTVLPVLDEGRLVGVVTKNAMVRASGVLSSR